MIFFKKFFKNKNKNKNKKGDSMSNFIVKGKCRCEQDSVQFQYTKEPFEVHYCLCTDCTETCGGALAIIAVVENAEFEITANQHKVKNFDSLETCHRKFCQTCGCHMFLNVDAYPDHTLVHVPTLERGVDIGQKPDRWVFTDSKHPMFTIPDDNLPRHSGWEATSNT